jgi:hypothetical protein
MHNLQVFILKLFLDPAKTECVRGALETVPNGATYLFTDEKALIGLLHELASNCDDYSFLPGTQEPPILGEITGNS